MTQLTKPEREAAARAIGFLLAGEHDLTDAQTNAAERAHVKLSDDSVDTVAQYQIRYRRPLPGGETCGWINCPDAEQYRNALRSGVYEGRALYER
jgi:hypothetical protein